MKFELNEYHRNISDDDLLDDIKRVAYLYHSNTLTREQYKTYGKYGSNTYLRRFGSWNTALQLCGLQVSVAQKAGSLGGHNYSSLTDEQLLSDLRRVANELGINSFSSSDYQKVGVYSFSTYYRRFGTWNEALTKASLEPNNRVSNKRINDDDLLSEIERVWIKLGRQPTATDIKNGVSLYTLNTYCRHFGGWRKALEVFIAYINNEDVTLSFVNDTRSASMKKEEKHRKEPAEMSVIKHRTLREPNLRLRFKVMMRDNFKCCACGASPAKDPSVVLHVDHITAWSKGGETVLENLQTYCSKCNLGKSDL